MKKKNEKLFNKAIHEVKKVIGDIQKERETYREDFVTLRKKHDKKMETMTSDLLEVIDDLHELFLDLTDKNTGE